jgi:hypothetical protein
LRAWIHDVNVGGGWRRSDDKVVNKIVEIPEGPNFAVGSLQFELTG